MSRMTICGSLLVYLVEILLFHLNMSKTWCDSAPQIAVHLCFLNLDKFKKLFSAALGHPELSVGSPRGGKTR